MGGDELLAEGEVTDWDAKDAYRADYLDQGGVADRVGGNDALKGGSDKGVGGTEVRGCWRRR